MRKIRRRKADSLVLNMRRREEVIKNLVFLYHACTASEGLLLDAAQATLDCEGLRAYYSAHLEEEKGELAVLKEDLAFGGIEPGMPNKHVMAMIGSQYYMLKHVHGCCLLGYLAVQEADPTPIKTVELLEDLYEKNLFRFLRMHAIKDLEHCKEIEHLIDSLPERFRPLIEWSADNTLDHYALAVKMWRTSNNG